ncbi:MAG TPA: serine/threonine-protein kinase [Acidimicrobiales bacterium]|nr:serine/threonine-protein kinase [Acidimicrobiales bacterium]
MSAGQQVGPYRLVERLGRGGMGEVWLAEDPVGAAGGTPRRVAVKLVDPALVVDERAMARFVREVDAARRIDSPRVARVLDADVAAARPWLASTYVAGPTLEAHVSRHGPLATGALRVLGTALAEALVAIHGAGVVHRDLNPRNVVLGPDGPCVVDFGIAWYDGAEPITRTGAWVGTPAWMPPERLAGDAVSPAGDVWSWGAVMAYAATGRVPAAGPTAEASAARAASGDLDLDGVPDWLAPTVRAALAPRPGDRPSATDLLAIMRAPGSRPPGRAEGAAEEVTLAGTIATTAAGGGPTRTRPRDGTPTAVAVPRAGARRALRWLVGPAVVAAAAAVGAVAPLLATIILAVVLVLVAIALRLATSTGPAGARPLLPAWSFALAAPVAVGVGVAQLVGPVGGAVAVLVLLVVFLLLGGELG